MVLCNRYTIIIIIVLLLQPQAIVNCTAVVSVHATSCKATTQLIIIGWHVHCNQGNETLETLV